MREAGRLGVALAFVTPAMFLVVAPGAAPGQAEASATACAPAATARTATARTATARTATARTATARTATARTATAHTATAHTAAAHTATAHTAAAHTAAAGTITAASFHAGSGRRDTGRVPRTAAVTMVVDVAGGHRVISPHIYGINDDKDVDPDFAANLAETHAGLVRLGGDRWTAYNWVNNASNAGSDYEYENDDFLTPSSVPGAAVLPTVRAAAAAGAGSMVTVPINGYVAADESPPGPVWNSGPNYLETRFKVEVPTDPGRLTATPNPAAAQVYENQFVYWLKTEAPKDYILFELDNEPDLWDSTHKEVHPDPTTYAELLHKDLEYAAAIKKVWPQAYVTGPVSYGWEGYETLQDAPDSAADGNFLDWYLKNVAAADRAAHTRLVNYLDLHWYPEATDPAGTRITGTDVTPAEIVAREQAPRSLWDKRYVERSWITADSTGGNAINLIPRLDAQIADHDPGTGLAITEWNYGGGQSISGAIATADVLGIFGRYGVDAASWWPLNPVESYSLAAFAAFRNYNGRGASFGDTEVSATTSDSDETSIYGSIQSTNPDQLVIVAINKNDAATPVKLEIGGGFATTRAAVFTLTATGPRLVAAPSLSTSKVGTFSLTMPAQSISVIVPVRETGTGSAPVRETATGSAPVRETATGSAPVRETATGSGPRCPGLGASDQALSVTPPPAAEVPVTSTACSGTVCGSTSTAFAMPRGRQIDGHSPGVISGSVSSSSW